jgi:hypothetical protein
MITFASPLETDSNIMIVDHPERPSHGEKKKRSASAMSVSRDYNYK